MTALHQILEDNINNIFAHVPISKVAIAVSAGSDSIALLFLLSNWANNHKIDLTVITVDHDLRPASRIETDYIDAVAARLGHRCFVLKWQHHNKISNLQERARIGRYDLMTKLCLELGIFALATAHHKDDFLENLCLRKSRKSGIFGLSSGYTHFYNNIMIIRPLSNVPKDELVAFLKTNHIRWFEDKSNYSDKYKRNQIRHILTKQSKVDLERELAEINKKASELQPLLIEAIAESVIINNMGFSILKLHNFNKFHKDIKFQVISYILTIISGAVKTPRAKSVALIIDLIDNKNKFIKTLHGCHLKKIDDQILIYREFGRIPPESVILHKGAVWDNRFYFEGDYIQDCYITSLSITSYKQIKKQISLEALSKCAINHHKQILFTLPVIKTLEKIIAIPHIAYCNSEQLSGKLNFIFQPMFVSRFTHFL